MTDDNPAADLTAVRQELLRVLDVEAGLADAMVAGRLTAGLDAALDPALDVEAGLDQILRGPRARLTALARFTDLLTSRPPRERLAVRAWLPMRELTDLGTIVGLTNDLDDGLADALDTANRSALDQATLTRAVEDARTELSSCARRYLPVSRSSDGPSVGAAIDRAYDVLSDLARELPAGTAGADAVLRGVAAAVGTVRELRGFLSAVRLLAFDRARKVHANTRNITHVSAFCLALAHDLDRDREVGRTPVVDRELITAIAALEKATTDVAGADLIDIGLTSIPLDGLRWSTTTRWPRAMADYVRRNSVEVEPGVYVIRHGGVAARV